MRTVEWCRVWSRPRVVSGGQLCPVTLYDPSVVPVPGSSSGSLRWRSYQTSLQYRCWQHGVPKPEWRCSSLHHHEWSKVTLFDFLLQVCALMSGSHFGGRSFYMRGWSHLQSWLDIFKYILYRPAALKHHKILHYSTRIMLFLVFFFMNKLTPSLCMIQYLSTITEQFNIYQSINN